MRKTNTEQTIAEQMRADLEAYNAKIDAARQANRERGQEPTMELGLTPGEIREATGANGETIRVHSVAGGSFTAVQVRDADGHLLYNRNERFEFDALLRFAEQKALRCEPAVADDDTY